MAAYFMYALIAPALSHQSYHNIFAYYLRSAGKYVVAVWGNTTPVPSAISTTIDTPVKPPTASLNFNTPTNLTAPLSTIESNANFQLQKPPIGNKRGKH
ncbi:hypothetical protein M0804_010814 [Polistes exclamans]|nr:hypothetical protein M0804_010814 [Polistes exclamans]